jgi:hypothetical protein
MENRDYFTDLNLNIEIENNNKRIQYLSAKVNEYQICEMDGLKHNYEIYKKYGEKIKKKKEKISELIERNHQLRKQLIIKQKKIKAKVYTL